MAAPVPVSDVNTSTTTTTAPTPVVPATDTTRTTVNSLPPQPQPQPSFPLRRDTEKNITTKDASPKWLRMGACAMALMWLLTLACLALALASWIKGGQVVRKLDKYLSTIEPECRPASVPFMGLARWASGYNMTADEDNPFTSVAANLSIPSFFDAEPVGAAAFISIDNGLDGEGGSGMRAGVKYNQTTNSFVGFMEHFPTRNWHSHGTIFNISQDVFPILEGDIITVTVEATDKHHGKAKLHNLRTDKTVYKKDFSRHHHPNTAIRTSLGAWENHNMVDTADISALQFSYPPSVQYENPETVFDASSVHLANNTTSRGNHLIVFHA